jgi:GGDEF domain-containing protein
LEWEAAVRSESARLVRYHRPLAIVAVWLDWQEHDRSGGPPEEGLRLLRPVGQTLRRQARASDRVARLGRDSFAIMLMETADLGAAVYSARVRDACRPWLAAVPAEVDLRLGWAIAGAGATMETAVLAAIAGARRDSAASVWEVAHTPAGPRRR